MARDNMTLGKFRLEGIPPAPRGVPQIEVEFDIDANGIMHAKAQDKATGREQQIRITASTNLSKSDVENLVGDAEQHRAEDESQRQQVELRNRADALAYQAEKALRDTDGAEPTLRTTVEDRIKDVREAVEADDGDRIQSSLDQLESAMHALSTAQYAAAQEATAGEPAAQAAPDDPGQAGGAAPGEDDAGDDVVEGEFRET
jgi:molecular chaperone DnaK